MHNMTEIEEKFSEYLEQVKQDLDDKADDDGMVKVPKEWLLENEKHRLMYKRQVATLRKVLEDLEQRNAKADYIVELIKNGATIVTNVHDED